MYVLNISKWLQNHCHLHRSCDLIMVLIGLNLLASNIDALQKPYIVSFGGFNKRFKPLWTSDCNKTS